MNCNNRDCPAIQTDNWHYIFTEKSVMRDFYSLYKAELPKIAYAYKKRWRPVMHKIRGGKWGAIYECALCGISRFKTRDEIALEDATGLRPRRR